MENTLEDPVDQESQKEEIVILPGSDLNIKAPFNQEVQDLAFRLHEKSNNGDGTLSDKKDYLIYSKDYNFCAIRWIIVDSRIENNDQLKKALKQATKKSNDNPKLNSEYTTDNFVWFINTQSTTEPMRWAKKGTSLLKLKADIYHYFDFGRNPKDQPSSIDSEVYSTDLLEYCSPFAGHYSLLEEVSRYRSYGICFSLFRTEEDLLKHRFSNHYSTHQDPFTNRTIFKWASIGTPSKEYLNVIQEQIDKGVEQRSFIRLDHWLNFKLKNVNGVDYITFEFKIKEIKLRANDSIFFLLSNNEVIEFRLPEKFYTLEQRILKGVDVPLSQEELRSLSKYEIEKVRVHEKKNNFKLDIGIANFIHQWDMYKEYRQHVIRNLFADHLKQVENMIDDYKPITGEKNVKNDQNNDPCHVYLMKDLANGFYKIGISNEPKYREHTLQSEKPTIEFIESKEFPSRKIADSFEKALHDAFDSKRLRGEWFELDESVVEEIKKSLS